MNAPSETLDRQRRCPACDSSAGVSQGTKNDFLLLRCPGCATLYTAQVPTQIGSQDYDPFYTQDHLSVPDFINRRLDEIIARFVRYRRNNRLLDVGFGSGVLLQAATRAGWNAEGVEISEKAVEHARTLGLTATCGDLFSACYPNGYFDVITASEVLEHIPGPGALVREVARILRPGGLFWATTPQSQGISARMLQLGWSVIWPPEHLQLFTADGVRTLLSQAGFRKVRAHAHGANPFEIYYALKHRVRHGGKEPPELFGRVASSQNLNEYLSESPVRKTFKNLLNGVLSLSGLGDNLKIQAER